MITKDYLKQKIAEIEGDKSNSPDRELTRVMHDLMYYQRELITSNVTIDFHKPLAEIVEGEEDMPVGVHGHTRRQYVMAWESLEGKYCFTLENTLAQKKKRVSECPYVILKDIMPLLPKFIEAMAHSAEKKLVEE